jgi:3-oxoacyl-[acyl-carrier-protein] synthase III
MSRNGDLASILSIAYYLGASKPIEELDFLRDDLRKLQLYRLGGFQCYAESDLSMRELARRAAAQTLEASGIEPDKIGVLLYVAESFDRDEVVSSAEVNRLLLDLGLGNAVPIHISLSDCANIVAALRVATALVGAGGTEYVLVASADKASRRYGGRRMFQDMSVKSDVSLSCLVSRPGVGTYGIRYIGHHNSAMLTEAKSSESAAYAMEKFKGIRRAAKRAMESLRLQPGDFARVITNNYGREVTRMFVELCGFPKEAGCFGNISRFAHAVAGDVLINLKDLETDGAFRPGDQIFLMADSITATSVLCLQRRDESGRGDY